MTHKKGNLISGWQSLLHKYIYPRQAMVAPSLQTHELQSMALDRDVRLDVFLPPGYDGSQTCPLLLLNDGQDLDAVGLLPTLRLLYEQKALPHLIAVGIYANERRIREYGTAHRSDYQGRGDLAGVYERFILDELMPWLNERYKLSSDPSKVYFAGFSLGGLSAFDLVWRNPRLFGGVGVFSGALWWRAQAFNPQWPDAHRIAHEMVHQEHDVHPHLRFWFQAGTHDETSDRNNNGVIDAIDDTLDLMHALEHKGYLKGHDLTYVEVDGGQHNQATWGKVMGVFLRWAFG